MKMIRKSQLHDLQEKISKVIYDFMIEEDIYALEYGGRVYAIDPVYNEPFDFNDEPPMSCNGYTMNQILKLIERRMRDIATIDRRDKNIAKIFDKLHNIKTDYALDAWLATYGVIFMQDRTFLLEDRRKQQMVSSR